jgi:flagellar motor switch protein FliN/FliY
MSGVCQPLGSQGRASSAAVFQPCALRDLNGTVGTASATGSPGRAGQRQTRTVRIELGRRSLTLDEVEQLGRGSVVRLQERQGDPVNVYADELLIARGQLRLQDGRLSVRITELVSSRLLRGPCVGPEETPACHEPQSC